MQLYLIKRNDDNNNENLESKVRFEHFICKFLWDKYNKTLKMNHK